MTEPACASQITVFVMNVKPTPEVTCTISKTFNALRLILTVCPPVELVSAPLETQLESLNVQISAAIQKYAPGAEVIQQTVFLKNYEDRKVCQQIWREYYGEKIPVNVYVPQAPCDGQLLAAEVLVQELDKSPYPAQIMYRNESLLALKQAGVTLFYACQQEPDDYSRSMYAQSVGMFQELDKRFSSQKIPFENVVRTWLYLGNITEPTFSELEGKTQRYKELNRARTDFFRDIRFFDGVAGTPWTHAVYPASTGIGADGNTVVMSALAVHFEDPLHAVILPLENPQQTSAFDYGAEYSIKSPKFARALLLANRDSGMIFVSGTASIIEQETWYKNDPEKQTELTLNNIEVLINERNLAAHGKPGFGCELSEMVSVRVYVKHPEDYEIIRAVCERRIPEVPKTYTFADVCRPDLLVEIEGIADVGPSRSIERK